MLDVALLQMTTCGTDLFAGTQQGVTFCRAAAARGADIALFPEMWTIGYTPCPDDPVGHADWMAHAINITSDTVRTFQALAAELDMAIAFTLLEAHDPLPYNTLLLIDRHGEVVLTYRKVHTCDFGMECNLTPGDGFHVAPLDTWEGHVQVGVMICYDREFPESSRVLMLKGAEVVLVPNACELEINRLSQFRTRAFENMTAHFMTNYAGEHGGRSVAYDGIAFNREEGSRDMTLVEASAAEGIYMARFDLDALRDYRAREAWGNSYRKPYAYGALTAEDVQAPFRRPDARRKTDCNQ